MRMSDWSSDVCSSDLVGGDFSVVDGDVEVLADQDALAGKVEVAHSLDGHGVVARERKSGARGRSSAVRFAEGPGGTSLSGYPQRQAKDRKSVVSGKSVSVGVDLGGGCVIKQKKKTTENKR